MFRGVPLLGLTATATTKILLDVQKILQIQGCLVLKSSFNRPNLYYEVTVFFNIKYPNYDLILFNSEQNKKFVLM